MTFRFLKYFHDYSKGPRKDLKVKSKTELITFLAIIKEVLADGRQNLSAEVFRKL